VPPDTWYLIILDLVAIVTMIRAPAGVCGFIVNRTDLHLFPTRHRVRYIDSDSGPAPAQDLIHASPGA
jgi:branched-chain amino acid transport system permease protein